MFLIDNPIIILISAYFILFVFVVNNSLKRSNLKDKLKIKEIKFLITKESRIIVKEISEIGIKDGKEFLEKVSNFTKDELLYLGVNLEKIKNNEHSLLEEIYKENEFINFLKSDKFKKLLKVTNINEDEFKKLKKDCLNSNDINKKIFYLNFFIAEKKITRLEKLNEILTKKMQQ